MEKITEFFSELWERVSKGPLAQVVIVCSEDDYEFGMDMKKKMHDFGSDVGVKLVMAEKLDLTGGPEEDVSISIEAGTLAFTYVFEGHWFVRPSIETHTMKFEKEEN